jgi:hypothetical protein
MLKEKRKITFKLQIFNGKITTGQFQGSGQYIGSQNLTVNYWYTKIFFIALSAYQ